MIAGVIMLFVAMWMYQATVQANKKNMIIWVVIGTAVFFVAQYLLVNLNVFILESIKDSRSEGMLSDRPLTSIKQDDISGITGFLLSMYMEFMPPFGGVIAAALVRTLLILKVKLTLANLFSGIKELFSSIGASFRTSEK